jgi:outer membrane protein assembly factor BamB
MKPPRIRPSSKGLLWLTLPLTLILALAASAVAESLPGDWPQFRGPRRDGTSPEQGLLRAWPETGPKELWRVPLGEGYAGISVVDGRAFTLFSSGDDELLAAFDAATGKEVWRLKIGANLKTEMGNGPRSTPTVADGVVYAMGSDVVLFAADAATGAVRWQADLKARFGSRLPQWGPSASPLVDGDLVIVEVGGETAAFAALSRPSGDTRWTALDSRMGYSSPVAMTIGGLRHYVFAPSASRQVVGLGQDGALLWTYEWSGGTIATPVPVGDERIFVSASNDVGGALIRITSQDGKFAAQEVWKNQEMKNHFSSSVAQDGYLYGFDNGTLKCISVETGERKWVKRGLGKGSLIIADSLLIILGDQGQLVLAEATPEAYKETARAGVLDGKTWTSPSLAGRHLYLRDMSHLVCLDLAA